MATQIELTYDGTIRLWFQDDGFDRLYQFIHECCELIYPLSCKTPCTEKEQIYYDTKSSVKFDLYDPDTYPTDGFKSTFFSPFDFQNIFPIGNIRCRQGETFYRTIYITNGKIISVQLIPYNVQRNSSRKSALVATWCVVVEHFFLNGLPSNKFKFKVLPSDANGASSFYPGYFSLCRFLGITPVAREHVINMPSVNKFLRSTKPRCEVIPYCPDGPLVQKWDEEEKRWRGVIRAIIKTGRFFPDYENIEYLIE